MLQKQPKKSQPSGRFHCRWIVQLQKAPEILRRWEKAFQGTCCSQKKGFPFGLLTFVFNAWKDNEGGCITWREGWNEKAPTAVPLNFICKGEREEDGGLRRGEEEVRCLQTGY